MTLPSDLRANVSHAEVEEYLQILGWARQPPGPAGAMWVNGSTRVAVPNEGGFDEATAAGVVARIANYENREVADVARDIFFVRSDVAKLRAASSVLHRDTISLDSAGAMVGSARTMLRSCGTTAVRSKSHIRGNYSKIGDIVSEDARMAHTVRGSFIIPVVVPLSETNARRVDPNQLELGITRTRPEPFERRVTRTLAQSLRAITDMIVQPAKWPTQSQVDSMVEVGVSRELCTSIEQVITKSDVSELETSFEWAPAYPAPVSKSLSTIAISAEAAPILTEASRLLKSSRVEPDSVLTGTIVEFRRSMTDQRGQVAVSTMRHGKPAEVQVSLPLDLYDQAWLWHQQMRAVLVEGRVTSERGKPLRIERPTRFLPVDSETLFSAQDNEGVAPG